MIFIHYGSEHFNKEMFERPLFNGVQVHCLNKPLKGLWGSPVHSKKSWRDFCLSEDFRVSNLNERFLFKLKDSARVLKVLNTRDLFSLYSKYSIKEKRPSRPTLDWKRIAKSYDAMVLMMPDDHNLVYDLNLSSWDVDSVLIFNPDVVVELPKKSRVH